MMNCQECEKFLEEYLDGELSAHECVAVEAHLANCGTCANAYDALLSEQNIYSAYERDIDVSPRLWGSVEARIRAGASGGEVGLLQRVSAWFAPIFTAPRFSPALTAALVLLSIGLTVGVMKLTGPRGQSSNNIARNDQLNARPDAKPATTTTHTEATPQPVESAPPAIKPNDNSHQRPTPENRQSPANEQRKRTNETLGGGAPILTAKNTSTTQTTAEQTPEQLLREAEQRYIAAIQLLKRDVASKRSRLDAQTAARFDESLAAIDRSIAETRRAVQQHEGDPIAAQYMLSAYAKKVEVLREMAHVQQGND
ncbi:MAG: hypothetical protein QOE33_2147 [Acidobacteriota bacterium]|nr:hypothetical protein [Acidobacteriota bacterium]